MTGGKCPYQFVHTVVEGEGFGQLEWMGGIFFLASHKFHFIIVHDNLV